ncbi:MAG: DUF11 domain-containing protein [Burkholderiales bacterium]|nr:DUF11 domain-containing protein [Burkholderiales bacterium]
MLTGLAFGAAPAFAQSSADLVVNQTDSPDPGPAGGVFTYTVRIDNNGPDTAVAASVVNTLPPGSTFVSASTTHGSCGAPLGGVLTCPLGDLPFLDQATVTITVILPTPGVYVNTVSASATTPDPNPANNTDRTEDTTAINASNMTLAVVDTPDPVAAGANYSYAVTAINNGPAPATSQTISFPVPTGACVRSVPTGSGWSCTPSGGYPRCSGTISCVRNTTLANGASAPQLTVPAVANVGGSITGAFTVSSPLPDGDPTDNTITATTTVTGGSSDVQMTKTASPATVGVGSNVTYTLTPRFNGGEPPGTLAPNVITVTDTLGAGLTFVSAGGSGWSCSYASPVVTCERPGPYTGGNFTNMPVITIVATVTASGVVSNTARIDAPETDPIPANNESSVNVTGSNDADLSIAKTGPGHPVFPGDDFAFTLTPRNNGPVPLVAGQTVTVTDTVPAGFTLRAAPTGTNWTCSVSGAPPYPAPGPQTVTCTRILSAPFGVGNFNPITIPVETNSIGTFVNTACVALAGAGPVDPNSANDCSAPVSVPSTPVGAGADLEVTSKTANPNPVRAGEDLTYVISVRNNGPVDANNVVVTDALTNLVATGSLQSVSTTQGTCTPPAPTNGATINLSCALGTLVNSGTATITVVVRPLVAVTGNRTNTATINSLDLADPNRANNTGSVTSQVTALVDMTMTKTDTPDPVQAGTPLTYVVTARNNGPSTASTVVATDTLPVNAAFISATGTGGGSCTTPAVGDVGGTVTCTWATMTTGTQQTITIVVRPLTGAVSVHNEASVTTTTEETTTTNNSAAVDTAVTPAAVDILVNKVDTIDPVAVGQTTGYTITITNSGPSYATNVTMVDTFRDGGVPTATFSYQGNLLISPAGAGSCSEPLLNATTGTISCAFPGLAAGQSIVVTYDMRAEGIDAGTSGTTYNRVVVGATEPETQPLNNEAIEATTSRQAADLGIVKTAPATVLPGAALTWNLAVTNYGPHSSTGAIVSDTLPAGVTFVSATPGCVFSVGVVTCTLGTLASSASTALAINVTVNQPYNGANPLVNTATVATVNEIDLVPGNNTSTARTDVTPQADLAINKVVDNGAPAVGANVTFTLTAQNLGPDAAVAAQVADVLPAGYSLVSATPSVGTYNSGVWTIGNFASSASATLAIVATVQATGPYLNTATISSSTQDPNPNNNTSSASTAPMVVSSLAVAKTDNSATYVPGGTGTYVVTVTNGGPSAASNVEVSDILPLGVTLNGTVTCAANGTANCGSVSGIAGQPSFGTTGASIAAGAGNSIVFTVPVAYASSLTADPLTNTAEATAPSSPPASGSDSSSPTPRVALAVTKTDGSNTYTPGGTATYTVTVRNTGPSNSTNLTVADTLPSGVTLTGAATCAATGVATCGTVTGGTGGSSFGTTGATLGTGAGDALVFTVPVAFAAGMTTDPLVNTASATDVPSGSTASGTDSNTLARDVSLAVTKTDGSATYTPGGTATYTITVANTGLSTAASVTVTDALPAGVTLTGTVTCTTAGGSSCGTVTGAAGGVSLGTTGAVIVPGSANALVFTAPVAFAADLATDPLVNTASATDTPSGATGSGSDSNGRSANVSLAVTKTDNSPTYVPGGTATYVITVTNTGTSDALDVTVQDALPAGVTLTGTVTCAANGVALCGSVTGTAGQGVLGTTGAAIAAGAGNALVFTAPVAFAGSLDSNPLINTATATDLASDATASGSDSNTLAREVALTITKTDGQDWYTPGGNATYVIVVGNSGITDAVSVEVSEVLPAGVSISAPITCTPSGTASCGTITGGAIGSGSFGTTGSVVPAGGGSTLTFQVPVAFAAGMTTDPLVNTVHVTDRRSGASASASDSNRLGTTAITLGKTIAPATIAPGGTATLTITLGNPATSAATLTAAFVDTMPAGVTITSGNTGTCSDVTVAATSLTKAAGSVLPAGGCTIVVTITSSTPGTVVNTTGSLETSLGHAPPASAPLTVTTGTVPQADLSVVKTAGSSTVTPGGTISYTIVAHNAGPTPVVGAIVTDAFAATLSNVTWTCVASAGASCPASGTGNLNASVDLPVGGSATFTVTATVSASASGSLSNTATITPPPGVNDPDPDNNTSTVVVPVGGGTPRVDLGIVKTANGSFTPGQKGATYTIVVTNHGTIPTSGVVTVTDTVPAGLTATGISGPGWTCTQPAGPCTRSDPLAPGASYPPITLTVDVSASASGNVINVAHVEGGGDPGGDSSTVVTPIQPVTPPPGPTQPVPVDSPLALFLAALALALAGGWQLRRQRARIG